MLSGDVIEKFRGHDKEISSLDFDGSSLVTGGADGLLNIYQLPSSSSRGGAAEKVRVGGGGRVSMGNVLHSHREHGRTITGAKIINRSKMQKFDWSKSSNTLIDIQSDLVVSCSMDRLLVATDMMSGKVQWKVQVPSAPLCLDVTPDGAYIGMGMLDGTVLFYSTQAGKAILSFQAHESKVRSLQLQVCK